MIFQPNPYSVLLVSASKKLNEALRALLSPGEYGPVTIVGSVAEAKRFLLEQDADLVLVNSPLPDDPGIELAEDVCAQSEAGVLLLTRAEFFEEIYCRVVISGVVTLAKPTSSAMLSYALRVLCATRERLRRRKERGATVEEKIRELRAVNRAKWLLIEREHLTEPEAHHALEQLAMAHRITRLQAAERVLARQPGKR